MYSSTVAFALAALAPSAFGAILDVNVGPNGQFVYEPSSVHAMTGDIVRFHLFVSLFLLSGCFD
jgi:plastocyanin